MSDEIEPTGKALRVVEYLQTEFGRRARVFENHMRGGISFRIGSGEGRRLLLVSDVILDDTPEDKVGDLLRTMGIAKALEAIGKDVALVVTSEGLRSLHIEKLRR